MSDIFIPVIIVGIIALAAGTVLVLMSYFMSAEGDNTVRSIMETLPGANCGGCGYPGCEGYARAVAKGEAAINLCTPGGKETAEDIGKITGTAVTAPDNPKTAYVRCTGDYEDLPNKMIYRGIPTCTAAAMYYGGTRVCTYGCMGFGDCAKVCVFKAISFSKGVAVVDHEKCVGCGKCVIACPKELITILPNDLPSVVLCRNHDRGKNTRNVCQKGCVGCGLCAKACQDEAITMQDNLAVIDWEKCTKCGKCADVCPAGIIVHKT